MCENNQSQTPKENIKENAEALNTSAATQNQETLNLKPRWNTIKNQLSVEDWAILKSRPVGMVGRRTNYNYTAEVDSFRNSEEENRVIIVPGMNDDTLYSGLKSNIKKRGLTDVKVIGFQRKSVLVKTKCLQQQSTEDYPQTSS